MTNYPFHAHARLYLGRDWKTATAHGPRAVRTAAQAIRFAMEDAAPVSLRGARLEVDDRTYTGSDIKDLYWRQDFPLARKADAGRDMRHN
jgi:hypothetical protein